PLCPAPLTPSPPAADSPKTPVPLSDEPNTPVLLSDDPNTPTAPPLPCVALPSDPGCAPPKPITPARTPRPGLKPAERSRGKSGPVLLPTVSPAMPTTPGPWLPPSPTTPLPEFNARP